MTILAGIYYSHPHLFGRGGRGHREIVARLEDGAIISIPGIVLVEEVSVAGPQCCRSWQRQGSKGCHDVLMRSAEARSLKLYYLARRCRHCCCLFRSLQQVSGSISTLLIFG